MNKLEKETKNKILRFIPFILMLIVIYVFSAMPGDESGDTSGRLVKVVVKVVESIKGKGLTEDAIDDIHWIIRKMAHFCEFAALSWTAMFALTKLVKARWQLCLFSELTVILVATLDELHQYFVPGRSASIGDVCIDSSGGLLGVVVYVILFLRERKKIKSADFQHI